MEFDKVNIEKTSPEVMRVLSRFFRLLQGAKGRKSQDASYGFDIGRNS